MKVVEVWFHCPFSKVSYRGGTSTESFISSVIIKLSLIKIEYNSMYLGLNLMFGKKDDEEVKKLREQVENLKEQLNGLSKQLEAKEEEKKEEQPEKVEEPKTEQPLRSGEAVWRFPDFGDRIGEYVGGIIEGVVDNVMKDLDRSLGGLSGKFGPEKITTKLAEKSAAKETMKVNPKTAADLMNALGHENRITILGELVSGGRYASEFQEKLPDISASTLSSHLDVLEKAGLIVQEKARGRYLITMPGRLAYQMANEIAKQVEQNSL
jgi:DNA-binding HxlR family transcriptional regulator